MSTKQAHRQPKFQTSWSDKSWSKNCLAISGWSKATSWKREFLELWNVNQSHTKIKLTIENQDCPLLFPTKSTLNRFWFHFLKFPIPYQTRASLMKLLKKVKSSLKKYENVNQKALDHLDSEEELESLQNRLDGLLKVLIIFLCPKNFLTTLQIICSKEFFVSYW